MTAMTFPGHAPKQPPAEKSDRRFWVRLPLPTGKVTVRADYYQLEEGRVTFKQERDEDTPDFVVASYLSAGVVEFGEESVESP